MPVFLEETHSHPRGSLMALLSRPCISTRLIVYPDFFPDLPVFQWHSSFSFSPSPQFLYVFNWLNVFTSVRRENDLQVTSAFGLNISFTKAKENIDCLLETGQIAQYRKDTINYPATFLTGFWASSLPIVQLILYDVIKVTFGQVETKPCFSQASLVQILMAFKFQLDLPLACSPTCKSPWFQAWAAGCCRHLHSVPGTRGTTGCFVTHMSACFKMYLKTAGYFVCSYCFRFVILFSL